MSKETRSVFLVVLTLVIYATSIAIKTGSFVFPFPLNPFFFAAIAFFFAFLNWKKRFHAIIVFATGLMAILSSPVTWEVLISLEQQETFYKYPWFYWFTLLYAAGIAIWGIVEAIRHQEFLAKVMTLVGAGLAVGGLAIGNDAFLLSGFGLLTISGLSYPQFYPFNLLWLLLFLLECTKWTNYLLA